MTTVTYTVDRMTCGHCVAAVSGELSKLNGVKDASVDLDRGQVTVTSDADLDREAVRKAVEESGYELVA